MGKKESPARHGKPWGTGRSRTQPFLEDCDADDAVRLGVGVAFVVAKVQPWVGLRSRTLTFSTLRTRGEPSVADSEFVRVVVEEVDQLLFFHCQRIDCKSGSGHNYAPPFKA